MFVRSIFITLVAAAGAATAVMPAAAQQSYPNPPIHIIVGFQAGSSSDVAGAWLAKNLMKFAKQ